MLARMARKGLFAMGRGVLFGAVLLLAAGAARAGAGAARAGTDDANDPLESANRFLFESNLHFDRFALRPLAEGYRAFIPRTGRDGIRRVINNLRAPVIFFNDVLQANPAHAGETVGRFLINSTLGVAGIYDAAAHFGLPYHNEDFGQTLAVWGVAEGPYLMVPFIGPSNPRDLAGLAADIFMDPFFHIADANNVEYAIYLRDAVTILDWRQRNLELVKELEEKSVDFYAAVRSLYRQRRGDAIRNGKASPISPTFSVSSEWKSETHPSEGSARVAP